MITTKRRYCQFAVLLDDGQSIITIASWILSRNIDVRFQPLQDPNRVGIVLQWRIRAPDVSQQLILAFLLRNNFAITRMSDNFELDEFENEGPCLDIK
jgi:hypothetical protein